VAALALLPRLACGKAELLFGTTLLAQGGLAPVDKVMRPLSALLPVLCLSLLAGCSSVYYGALEKIGYAKREVLVDRVADTQKAQTAAKEQFESALQHFLAVTKADVGDLQRKYDDMNREFTRSESRAKEVRERIAAVEDVAEALFNEWKQELKQYSSASLRAESQRQLDATRRRYDDLLRLMRRAADRMEPVLSTFRDQVLFLKHNLNARALASLDSTNRALEADISRLVADMEASIREAESFVKELKSTP
jgi:Skp family chaperone for outer membrane proteins